MATPTPHLHAVQDSAPNPQDNQFYELRSINAKTAYQLMAGSERAGLIKLASIGDQGTHLVASLIRQLSVVAAFSPTQHPHLRQQDVLTLGLIAMEFLEAIVMPAAAESARAEIEMRTVLDKAMESS